MLYQDPTTLLPYNLFIHGEGAEDEESPKKQRERGIINTKRHRLIQSTHMGTRFRN